MEEWKKEAEQRISSLEKGVPEMVEQALATLMEAVTRIGMTLKERIETLENSVEILRESLNALHEGVETRVFDAEEFEEWFKNQDPETQQQIAQQTEWIEVPEWMSTTLTKYVPTWRIQGSAKLN